MEQLEVPTWALLISNSDQGLLDFIEWIAERKRYLADNAVLAGRNWEEVLGARYAIGELDALLAVVRWTSEEEARVAYAHGGEING